MEKMPNAGRLLWLLSNRVISPLGAQAAKHARSWRHRPTYNNNNSNNNNDDDDDYDKNNNKKKNSNNKTL